MDIKLKDFIYNFDLDKKNKVNKWGYWGNKKLGKIGEQLRVNNNIMEA